MSSKINFLIAVFVIILFFIGAKIFLDKGGLDWFSKIMPKNVADNESPLVSAPVATPVAIPSPVATPQIKQWNEPPAMNIDTAKKYFALLETSEGNIKIELFAKETPKAVNNFVFLSRQNFYNGLKFHRIIKNFMIQGGDPKGDGTGGPGYKFEDEKIIRDYSRGIIAYANSGPNTNGSQFFIMHKNYPLPKNYVIFGQVVEGMEVVDKIAETPVGPNGAGENSKPLKDVIIKSITIEEK